MHIISVKQKLKFFKKSSTANWPRAIITQVGEKFHPRFFVRNLKAKMRIKSEAFLNVFPIAGVVEIEPVLVLRGCTSANRSANLQIADLGF